MTLRMMLATIIIIIMRYECWVVPLRAGLNNEPIFYSKIKMLCMALSRSNGLSGQSSLAKTIILGIIQQFAVILILDH